MDGDSNAMGADIGRTARGRSCAARRCIAQSACICAFQTKLQSGGFKNVADR